MTIGEKLKKQRLALGLSRSEFVHGIIDKSYLACIENGRSEIRVNDLIAILQQNNLSLLSFLTDFGDVKFNLSSYESRANEAFFNHNIAQMKEISKACPDNLTREVIDLMIAKLKHQLINFPESVKEKIKKVFWQMKQWNTDFLWIFSNVMEIYDFSALEGLTNSIFHNFSTPAEYGDDIIKLLATITINYLQICLAQPRINHEEVKRASDYLIKLPAIPLIAFEKMKGKQLIALYHSDYCTAKDFSKIFGDRKITE